MLFTKSLKKISTNKTNSLCSQQSNDPTTRKTKKKKFKFSRKMETTTADFLFCQITKQNQFIALYNLLLCRLSNNTLMMVDREQFFGYSNS